MRLSPEKRALLCELKPEDTVSAGVWWAQIMSERWSGKNKPATRKTTYSMS